MQIQKTVDHITRWLKSYNRAAGLNGFVVGISGGIDSAVTSTLCANTKERVLALNMPIHQAQDQYERAERHIRWLQKSFSNVERHLVDLSPVLEQISGTFPSGVQDELTMANTKSRLRMITLYAFASHFRMLVVGTGNKVEDFGVGFFTKYGDGGVDISPVADLVKSEIYAVGKKLGVLEEILNAPPTDGLFDDNRTDEGQIGATYPELEKAMSFKGDPGSLSGREKQVMDIFLKFHAANRHKMQPVPVCIIPDEFRQ